MTKKYIRIADKRFLIRGTGVTAADLRQRYASFVAKFGNSLTLEQWAVERGGVYLEVKK